MIRDLIQQYAGTIPRDDPDRSELIEGFREYLDEAEEGMVERLENRASSLIAVSMSMRSRARKIINLSLEEKRELLARDKALENLEKLEYRTYMVAVRTLLNGDRLSDKLKHSDFKNFTNRMHELRDSVKESNRARADELYSHIFQNINFIYAPGAGIVSPQLAAFYYTLPASKRQRIDQKRFKSQLKYVEEIKHNNEEYLRELDAERRSKGISKREFDKERKKKIERHMQYTRIIPSSSDER